MNKNLEEPWSASLAGPRPTSTTSNNFDLGEQWFVGIDPGASGGLAAIREYDQYVAVSKMPDGLVELAELIEHYDSPLSTYMLEKVGGYVGGAGQPGSAMFNFGRGFGRLEALLVGRRHELVLPQAWQKAMGIPPKKRDETKTQWKNRLKAKAQALFPGVKVTLDVADALLIAEHCRRTHR